MRASFDVGDLQALSAEFTAAPDGLAAAARDLVEESAISLRDDWRKNATATAGRHGRHYPRSINYHMSVRVGLGDSIEANIRPDARFRQGGMAFEFGSRNQPPHLDGQRALDENGPRMVRRVEALRFL